MHDTDADTSRPARIDLQPGPKIVGSETSITSGGQVSLMPTKVLAKSEPARGLARFELLQQWDGTIESVADGVVRASVRDLTNRAMPDEVVDLPREEFADADANLIAPGSVFYWSIGYRVTSSGTKERLSTIRMRRLPAPTKRQLERIATEATELSQMFGGCQAELSGLAAESNDWHR